MARKHTVAWRGGKVLGLPMVKRRKRSLKLIKSADTLSDKATRLEKSASDAKTVRLAKRILARAKATRKRSERLYAEAFK